MSSNNSIDGKLVLLYILNKVNKDISAEQLQKISDEYEPISYFYMQQYLFDLQAKNMIEAYIESDVTIYRITDIGIQTLNSLVDIVPGIELHRLSKSIENKVVEIKKEYSSDTEFFPINDNEYKLNCYIKEGNEKIINISLYAGSKENAKLISNNWKQNSDTIYTKLLNILTGNDK